MPYSAAKKASYVRKSDRLTPAERELIKFYDEVWFLTHKVPSVEEVHAHLKKHFEAKFPGKPSQIKFTSVNYYLTRPPVIRALKERGIPWEDHSRGDLTPEQVAAAITVMNFADNRSIPEKLNQMGIAPAKYYAWQEIPQFKNLLASLETSNLENIRPSAIAEFTRKINAGDWQAIRYYLDASGAANKDSAPQSEILLKMVIEVIQKHVKDPKVMTAIAKDLILVSQNKTLTADIDEEDVIEGDFSEEALQVAQYQLGIG